jgi:hypothetical protein
MDHRIDGQVAHEQFGHIMDLASLNDERFIVDRDGEPSVIIMSVKDFIRTAAPPPEWLQQAWAESERKGLERLTMEDIDSEIADYRRSKGNAG